MTAAAITPATIEQLTPGLFAFAYKVVRQREDAEDLVQDTWVSALRTLPSFEGRSSLRTWLVSILRRRIADKYRRAKPVEELSEDRVAVDIESADARAANMEAASLVRDALPTLTELERRAVELCDVHDFDRERAAEEMGVTRGHLRVLLHRGRQKLQTKLTQQGVTMAA